MFHCSRFEKQKGRRCGGSGAKGERMGGVSPSNMHIINTVAHVHTHGCACTHVGVKPEPCSFI